MKRILIIAGSILAVLVIAVIALPFLIPSSVYKSQIESAATKALGRNVTLIGSPSISVFPSISARIDGAEVENPEGFTDPLMIKAGQLKANVKLWPLLSQRVEIGEITLSDATVRLERLPDGTANWEFTSDDSVQAPDDGATKKSSGFETGIARAGLTNTAVYFNDRQNGQSFALTEFNMTARLTAMDAPFSSKGDGRFNGQAFDYDVAVTTIQSMLDGRPSTLDFTLGTDFGDVSYNGGITLAEVPILDGDFSVSSSSPSLLLTMAGVDATLFNFSELKSVDVAGAISGPVATALIDLSKARVEATGLDLNYDGSVVLGDVPVLDGKVTIKADRAQRLFNENSPFAAPLTVLGKVDLAAVIVGSALEPSLSQIKLTQRGDTLTTDFTGAAALSGDQTISGSLEMKSGEMRALLTSLDIQLADGETLQSFAIKGDIDGSMLSPMLTAATITLDQTKATGRIGADLRASVPRLEADLKLGTLDLSPFMGAQESTPREGNPLATDWDDSQLALDALKAVNATISLQVDTVIIDQIKLVDANLKTRLDNGRLSAIFDNEADDIGTGFKAFGGNWSGSLVLDASRTTPTLSIDALADGVAAQKLLTDLTGFSRLSGLGDVLVDMESEGNSLKALVSGLDGRFESDLSEGALKGINLAKLVRSGENLTEVLKSGDLSMAGFKDVISADAETDFTSFIGNLSFTNGVANLSEVKLDNPVLSATASGSVSLAAKTLDIRFTPRVDANAKGGGNTIGLSGIPIPIRISGTWANPQYGLDTSAVRAELTARARGTVADTIRDRVGGDVGGIIGDIVGGQRTQSPAAPSQDGTQVEAAPEKSLEDELKDRAVEGALGAIFGRNKEEEPKEETVEAPE
jgi:AsmA protein